MILRWESDCSLSSTHRIVRFGFISLRPSAGAAATAAGEISKRFSQYEECQSELHANGNHASL
jgi:hypothetical protein